MADIELSAREAEESSLDIDEVAADSLEMPDFPDPSMTLADLDLALNLPGVLPPGIEWRRLDPGSYALRLPGMDQEVRVTTQADVFDDHFESHEFLSPGGDLFEALASMSLGDEGQGREATRGNVWLVRNPSTRTYRFVARSGDAIVPVESLAGLLTTLTETPVPGYLPEGSSDPGDEPLLLA
jgi:hypothetical protein